MPEKITFAAQPRTVVGKKVSTLRRAKLIPANINGDVEQSVAVTVDCVSFSNLYKKVGDTGLFYLKVEGEKKDRPVLISEVQDNPVSGEVTHVVFRQVDLREKVSAEVPVELIGELDLKDVLVVTLHDSVEVSALPQDLPEKFEVDISKFTEAGQMVTFRQLSFDASKVELEVEEENLDDPVVMVQEVKEQVEEVAAPAEGEAPAEGAAAPAEGEASSEAAPTE